MMQGSELPNPSMVASRDLPSAHELPSSPPTLPRLAHPFSESEDTTGQARMRSTTGTAVRSVPQVVCRIVPGSVPIQVLYVLIVIF